MSILFRPEAREEIIAARQWYEARAAGLGSEFVRALETAVGSASRNPRAGRRVGSEFWRTPLRRFPYFLVYQTHGEDLIVLACFHHRRDPKILTRRMAGQRDETS